MRRLRFVVSLCVLVFLYAAPSVAAQTPEVLATNIQDGAQDINPRTAEVVIRFNTNMQPRNGTLEASNATLAPKFGRGVWDRTARVLTVPITLEPLHTYQFTIGRSFRSAAGVGAKPKTIHFRTSKTWSDARFVTPETGIVYGEVDGIPLTMDRYAPRGNGPHPVAIIIHGGGFVGGTSRNGSEAYCADFLAPAGYAVFSINYRLYPRFGLPDMVADVQRAVRFVRHNAQRWNLDAGHIALVGGSAGGYLSNMAGLLGSEHTKQAKSGPVDQESATVQAVVTLFGLSDLRRHPMKLDSATLLGRWSIAEASPITHITRVAPPFLLIHGDRDQSVALDQSTRFQQALQAAGVRCDLVVIPKGPHATGTWHQIAGVPDWEKQMTDWLKHRLWHKGEAGPGIRARLPAPSN